MDEEILQELRDVVRRFKNEEYVLDQNIIHNTMSFRVTRFEEKFPETMSEFRRLDANHETSSDAYDYKQICKEFLEMVTIGKANKIIVKRADQQELHRLRERTHFLESELYKCESDKKAKEQELSNIKALIEGVTRANPFLQPFFNIQEGEVENKDERLG